MGIEQQGQIGYVARFSLLNRWQRKSNQVWRNITLEVEVFSIGYGIVSMVSWGFADFLTKRIVGAVGYYRLLLYTHLVGLAPLLPLAVWFGVSIPHSMKTTGILIASGVCSFSAVFFLYRGLAVGKASIVTPVASTWAIAAMLFSFILFGETLSLSQILCIVMVLAGILVLSMRSNADGRSNVGIAYAFACMLFAGLNSILFKVASKDVGEIGTLFFNRILVTIILLVTISFLRSPLLKISGRTPYKSMIAAGLTEFAGMVGFIVGVGVGIVSIIAPISSASPAVTVVLAQVFLKENLTRMQKTAIALIIAGIVTLSILSL